MPGGLSSRAPMTPVVRRSAPASSVEVIRYTVKVGRSSSDEGAVGEPGGEQLRGDRVAVVAVGLVGEVDAARRCAGSRAASAARCVGVDHVVGRRDHLAEVGARRGRSGCRGTVRIEPRPESGRLHPVPFALDLDGVIWLADDADPGAADAVRRLQAAGEPVVFVTNNSSQPVGEVEAKLARHGIAATGDVITSAMAAAALLEPGERVLVCGGPGVVEALEGRGAVVVRDGARRRGAGGVPPRLRLRAAPHRRRGGAGRGAAARDQRRRHLPHARRADPGRRGDPRRGRRPPRACARSWRASRTRPMVDLVRDRLGERGVMVGDRPDTDGALRPRARLRVRAGAQRRHGRGADRGAAARPRGRRTCRRSWSSSCRSANSCKHSGGARRLAVMAQNDLLKRYIDAGVAFTALTQSRAERLVRELVKAGELQADQAREAVVDLLERSRKNSERLIETVRTEVRSADHEPRAGQPGRPRSHRAAGRQADGEAGPEEAQGPRARAGEEGPRQEGHGQEGGEEEGPRQEGGGQEGRRRRPPPRRRRRRPRRPR